MAAQFRTLQLASRGVRSLQLAHPRATRTRTINLSTRSTTAPLSTPPTITNTTTTHPHPDSDPHGHQPHQPHQSHQSPQTATAAAPGNADATSEAAIKEKMEEFLERHGGGIPGIETENGKPTEMKNSVKANMFRYI